MAKQLVKVDKEQINDILKRKTVDAYFYLNYWEFCSAHFEHLKQYPSRTLSADMLENELDKLLEKNHDQLEDCIKLCGNNVITAVCIGYFDKTKEDFHIIACR